MGMFDATHIHGTADAKYSYNDMFFKQYTAEDFLNSLRVVAVDLAVLGLIAYFPFFIADMLVIALMAGLALTIIVAFYNNIVEKNTGTEFWSFMLNAVQIPFRVIFEFAYVLPMTLITLVTRGISTVVHAAYDACYSNPGIGSDCQTDTFPPYI